jgi:molybdopterin-binding protein
MVSELRRVGKSPHDRDAGDRISRCPAVDVRAIACSNGQCDGAYTTPADHKEAFVKISARNRLKGKIVDVKKGATTAHVRLDVNGTTVTASITNEAVDELGLKVGQTAYAIIKASDVMVGLDD